MKYNLIYSLGREVDEECLMKGTRGDLLLEDNLGNCYELNFITIERLTNVIDQEHSCYFETNLVITINLEFKTIIESIRNLHRQNFIQSNWKPLSQEIIENFYYPKEKWEIYEIEF